MHSNSTYISSIDVSTGALLSYECDFEINGVLLFILERFWHSDSAFRGRLGYGWYSFLDMKLKIDFPNRNIGFITQEGNSVSFPYFNNQKKNTSTEPKAWKYSKPKRAVTVSGMSVRAYITTLPKGVTIQIIQKQKRKRNVILASLKSIELLVKVNKYIKRNKYVRIS